MTTITPLLFHTPPHHRPRIPPTPPVHDAGVDKNGPSGNWSSCFSLISLFFSILCLVIARHFPFFKIPRHHLCCHTTKPSFLSSSCSHSPTLVLALFLSWEKRERFSGLNASLINFYAKFIEFYRVCRAFDEIFLSPSTCTTFFCIEFFYHMLSRAIAKFLNFKIKRFFSSFLFFSIYLFIRYNKLVTRKISSSLQLTKQIWNTYPRV